MIKKKALIEFHSKGESGNIFWILCTLRNEMRKQRRIIDYNNALERVQNSNDYCEALKIVREYVNLKDLDGVY